MMNNFKTRLVEILCGIPGREKRTLYEETISVQIGGYCEHFRVKADVHNVFYDRFNKFVAYHFYGVSISPLHPSSGGEVWIGGDAIKGLNMYEHDLHATRQLLKRCTNHMLDRRIEIHTLEETE